MNSSNNSCDVIEAPDLVTQGASGRATWDERGNGVWEWQTQPGVFTREISSQQMTQLEANQLQLVDAFPRRNFEGLWIHDTDRTLDATYTPSDFARAVQETVRRPATQIAKRRGFDTFMRRLGLTA